MHLTMTEPHYIHWFNSLSVQDVALVGGKNASLGEMVSRLGEQGVPVPNGFAISAQAYRDTLEQAGVMNQLKVLLKGVDKNQVEDLARRGREARERIFEAPFTDGLREQILTAYHQLIEQYGEGTTVAVRSSATAEDLPTASFAGQQESYLNVSGDEMLLEMCHRCFASLFTDRAISYRIDHGFGHFDVALSIGIQKMVRSDHATSGVMFSIDTETGFKDAVFITAAHGLGEPVVQGAVDPDEFYVHKPTYKQGYRAVLRRNLGKKRIKMVYALDRTRGGTRVVPTPKPLQQRFSLTDKEVLKLAEYAIKVEDHYSALAGKYTPMDLEWAKDGRDGEIYVVQARPETVFAVESDTELVEYRLKEAGEVIAKGRAVGRKIAKGKTSVLEDADQLSKFKPGDVLVTDNTTPDWEPIMKTASAIVTNRGGRTCHAAIVARELGIPAVVGCENATETIDDGSVITVSCATGEEGLVYPGSLDYDIIKTNLDVLSRPDTRIMMNVGNPDIAFSNSRIPNDGVGLARIEFIISDMIGVHPMALLHPEEVKDEKALNKIQELTDSYDRGKDFFVDRLTQGIGTIAAAFFPKPVIVRFSDFKSNEYRSLVGGRSFEAREENPMLGFRGAARYIHARYIEAFGLECQALKVVRETMGLKNVIAMIPFCRSVEEGKAVLDVMKQYGLERGKEDLKVYLMCEIPSNVLQLGEFARLFDGFSIGSNDLTQLVLGVDRDSALVSGNFDERDPGVLAMLDMAISRAHKHGRTIGICGQAPSDFPEITTFLVERGIDSISLNPDTVLKTTVSVLDLERHVA